MGCESVTIAEKRGFTYTAAFGHFSCDHEPAQSAVRLNKEAVTDAIKVAVQAAVKAALGGLGVISAKANLNPDAKVKDVPVTQLVRHCQQLIQGDKVQ